jgi:hypothetical protein
MLQTKSKRAGVGTSLGAAQSKNASFDSVASVANRLLVTPKKVCAILTALMNIAADRAQIRSTVRFDQPSRAAMCRVRVQSVAIHANKIERAHDKALADKMQRNRSNCPIRQEAASNAQRSMRTFENDGDHEAKGAQEKAEQAGSIAARVTDSRLSLPVVLFHSISGMSYRAAIVSRGHCSRRKSQRSRPEGDGVCGADHRATAEIRRCLLRAAASVEIRSRSASRTTAAPTGRRRKASHHALPRRSVNLPGSSRTMIGNVQEHC